MIGLNIIVKEDEESIRKVKAEHSNILEISLMLTQVELAKEDLIERYKEFSKNNTIRHET